MAFARIGVEQWLRIQIHESVLCVENRLRVSGSTQIAIKVLPATNVVGTATKMVGA